MAQVQGTGGASSYKDPMAAYDVNFFMNLTWEQWQKSRDWLTTLLEKKLSTGEFSQAEYNKITNRHNDLFFKNGGFSYGKEGVKNPFDTPVVNKVSEVLGAGAVGTAEAVANGITGSSGGLIGLGLVAVLVIALIKR